MAPEVFVLVAPPPPEPPDTAAVFKEPPRPPPKDTTRFPIEDGEPEVCVTPLGFRVPPAPTVIVYDPTSSVSFDSALEFRPESSP